MPSSKEKKQLISFRFSSKTLNQLDDLSKKLETDRTKTLEAIIEDYFEKSNPQKPQQKIIKDPRFDDNIVIERVNE